MPLGQTAELLFKIKADASQANREINETENEIQGFGDVLTNLGGRAGLSAGAMSGAAAAFAAFGAIAAAQIRFFVDASVGLFNLAKAASDAGSELFDAQGKTGLTAETLSTLKLNADSAGSSFDGITSSVAKFNVLVGQANQGNEKAIETLDKYGIKSRDLNGALNEAIKIIAAEEDATKKAALAKDLFKDKTGGILPVIDQMGGNLAAAEKAAEKLGTTLTDSNIRAADEFGDMLTQLNSQVQTAAQRFALEFAPAITNAMSAISQALANNQGVARVWGNTITDVLYTARAVWLATGQAIGGILDVIGIKFKDSASQARFWAEAILFAMSPVLALAARVGAVFNKNVGAGIGGDFDPSRAPIAMPSLSTGSGGGGGGGGSGGGASGPSEFERRQSAIREQMEVYRQAVAEMKAENDSFFAQGIRNEEDYLSAKRLYNRAELEEEQRLTQELTAITSLSTKERGQLERDLSILESKLRQKDREEEEEIAKEQQKDWDDEIERVAKAGEARRKHEKELNAALEERRKLLQQIKDLESERYNDFIKKRNAEIEQRDPFGTGGFRPGSRRGGKTPGAEDWEMSGGGEFLTGVVQGLGAAEQQLPILQRLGESLSQTFGQVAQAVGSAVRSFVLFGTAGGSFRKFAAEVIASVAQMSVVQAVFEFAQGLAMSALFWFTGNAKYKKSSIEHFVAAAVFGSIGGVAAVAGRAVAGDSFSQATGGGGSGGGGDSDNGNRPGLAYTSPFAGFEQRNDDRNRAILEAFKQQEGATRLQYQAIAQALNRWEPRSATDVLMAAAGTNEGASVIFDANLAVLESDGTKSTELKRKMGDY